jgi:hypothetical protein
MFAKEIKFPQIPNDIADIVRQQAIKWVEHDNTAKENYGWIPANTVVDKWCKENVCEYAQWAVQVLIADLPKHIDENSQVKIQFLLETGGKNVISKSYKNNYVVHSIVCDADKWYILKTDEFHGVYGVTGVRIALAAKIY